MKNEDFEEEKNHWAVAPLARQYRQMFVRYRFATGYMTSMELFFLNSVNGSSKILELFSFSLCTFNIQDLASIT